MMLQLKFLFFFTFSVFFFHPHLYTKIQIQKENIKYYFDSTADDIGNIYKQVTIFSISVKINFKSLRRVSTFWFLLVDIYYKNII